MRIGLFLGSFNPLHIGHLVVAEYLAKYTQQLDEVWMVVSPHNPHKKKSSLLDARTRYYLVDKAVEGVEGVKASDVEFHLPQPSYTIHTVKLLYDKFPAYKFYICLGSDSILNVNRWKDAADLHRLVEYIVYPRPGYPLTDKELNPDIQYSLLNEVPLMEISASFIRNSIKEGKLIRSMLPHAVAAEIDRGGYYR